MQVCYCRVFLHRSVIVGCPRASLLLWGLPFKVCYCRVSPLQSVTVGSPSCWFVIVGSPHIGLLLQGVPRQVCYCRVSLSSSCTHCSGGVAWPPLGGLPSPPVSKGLLRGDSAYPLSVVGVPLCVPWHGRGTKPPSCGDMGTPGGTFGGARAGGRQGAQGWGYGGVGRNKEGEGDVRGAGGMLGSRETRCQGMGCQGMGCQGGRGGSREWGVRTRR